MEITDLGLWTLLGAHTGRQDGSRWLQGGPREPQNGPKTAQDGPKRAQKAPKTPQEGPKRTPKSASRSPNHIFAHGYCKILACLELFETLESLVQGRSYTLKASRNVVFGSRTLMPLLLSLTSVR